MVDHIPQNRILRPRNQWESHLFTSATSHLKFAHERCVTSSWSTRGNSRLKWAIPLKDIPTCSSTDIYHMCRTRHFRSKEQCATEIKLLNRPHDRLCCRCRQAMTPLWCSSINTLCFPQKNCRVHVRGRGWGRQRYLPPRLRGDMATPTAIALDSNFNLLLRSRILVGTNGNGRHHVIIGINHGYVCVVHINSLVRCLVAGRDNTLGSRCQQLTPIHD